ncbi:hypothetical protein T484DRAFT_1776364 [Baffinella frigidus]|nr:hypothetical protein T484DRAFT_1776364 [Cryptophyta sp. CCMP2293]
MAVALALAASTSLLASPMEASAELVKDKYGSWKQTICPVAYFPCWQDGQFCFRPIYCEGKFSPEGLLNASIIFAGILGPAYSIWSRSSPKP